jgi:hypothetical protein
LQKEVHNPHQDRQTGSNDRKPLVFSFFMNRPDTRNNNKPEKDVCYDIRCCGVFEKRSDEEKQDDGEKKIREPFVQNCGNYPGV